MRTVRRIILCLCFSLFMIAYLQTSNAQGGKDVFRAISYNSSSPTVFAYNNTALYYFTVKERMLLEDTTSFYAVSTEDKETRLLRKEWGTFIDIAVIDDQLFAERQFVAKFLSHFQYGFQAVLLPLDSARGKTILAEDTDSQKTLPRILEIVTVDHTLYAYIQESEDKVNLYRYGGSLQLRELVAENITRPYGRADFHDTFLFLSFGAKDKPRMALADNKVLTFPVDVNNLRNIIYENGVLYYSTDSELFAYNLAKQKKQLLWEFRRTTHGTGTDHFFAMEGEWIYFFDDAFRIVVAVNAVTMDIRQYTVDFENVSPIDVKFAIIDKWMYLYDEKEEKVVVSELKPKSPN